MCAHVFAQECAYPQRSEEGTRLSRTRVAATVNGLTWVAGNRTLVFCSAWAELAHNWWAISPASSSHCYWNLFILDVWLTHDCMMHEHTKWIMLSFNLPKKLMSSFFVHIYKDDQWRLPIFMIWAESMKPTLLAHLVHSTTTQMASTTLRGRTRGHSEVTSLQCPASHLHTVGFLETVSGLESWRRLLPPLCIPPFICQAEQQCTPVSSTGRLACEEPTSLAELSVREMAVVQCHGLWDQRHRQTVLFWGVVGAGGDGMGEAAFLWNSKGRKDTGVLLHLQG